MYRVWHVARARPARTGGQYKYPDLRRLGTRGDEDRCSRASALDPARATDAHRWRPRCHRHDQGRTRAAREIARCGKCEEAASACAKACSCSRSPARRAIWMIEKCARCSMPAVLKFGCGNPGDEGYIPMTPYCMECLERDHPRAAAHHKRHKLAV